MTWFDYCEADRQTIQAVLVSIRGHDTRDELGIGTVQDTLPDLLFPGTTAIQTRPRYFRFLRRVNQPFDWGVAQRVSSFDRPCDSPWADSCARIGRVEIGNGRDAGYFDGSSR